MFAPLRLIYPVVSRRSGGLSLGVDLFPDRKTCNFDCPYCEIFPFDAPEAEVLALRPKGFVLSGGQGHRPPGSAA